MSAIKYVVTLTNEEREHLLKITKKGNHRSRQVVDALILLNCDVSTEAEKLPDEIIRQTLNVGKCRVNRIRKRFVLEGFDRVLTPTHGGGHCKKKDGDFEAHLIALNCSSPPDGYSQWSLRLLADKMVELNYIEDVSHETIRQILKKTN